MTASSTIRRIHRTEDRKVQALRRGEEGYLLIAVLFMAFMILLLLAVAAPKVAASIERDREIELQHRGKQYVRAIKLYYKKFGAYPPNMDALVKTNNIRFLRRRYKDPVTGKDEWHLIHFGENKTPAAMGFFGKPLVGAGNSTLAGIGPGGVGQGGIGQGGLGQTGGLFNSNSGLGGGGLSGSGSGTDPNAGGAGGTAGGTTGGAAGTDTSGNAGTGTTGTTGTGTGTSGTTGTGTTSAFGNSNNQTFGGGGIIGVESTSPKATILEYKKKKHFNEWEFVYDPQSDQQTLSNNTGTIGQPVGTGGIQTPGTVTQPPNTAIPPQTQQNPLPQQPAQPDQPQ